MTSVKKSNDLFQLIKSLSRMEKPNRKKIRAKAQTFCASFNPDLKVGATQTKIQEGL